MVMDLGNFIYSIDRIDFPVGLYNDLHLLCVSELYVYIILLGLNKIKQELLVSRNALLGHL